jgi:hypothetical protein
MNTSNGSTALNGVSCPTTTFCMAVGDNGTDATFNGSTWTTGSLVTDTGNTGNSGNTGSGGNASLSTVSCASPTFCAAVDANGVAYTWGGSSWSTGTTLSVSNNNSNSSTTVVSCPVAGTCIAGNNNGGVATLANSAWSTPAQVDGNNSFVGVSCWAANRCAAVDSSNNVLYYGPKS